MKLQDSGSHKSASKLNGRNKNSEAYENETDVDREFLQLTDLFDMDRTYLDSAIEKFDETAFDAFTYCQILSGHSLQFISYKIF